MNDGVCNADLLISQMQPPSVWSATTSSESGYQTQRVRPENPAVLAFDLCHERSSNCDSGKELSVIRLGPAWKSFADLCSYHETLSKHV